MAARSRKKAADLREIAPGAPRVKNRKRRDACLASLELFCLTYFPAVFYRPFSNDHRKVIKAIEKAAREGGNAAIAMPRGSGKSALIAAGAMWAIFNGLVRFCVIVGAAKEGACEMLDSIRMQLQSNDLLYEDFPEICYPIRKLDGINQRKLLWHGERILMKFTADRITFPNLPKGKCSSSSIVVAGITGRLRGRKLTTPDGREDRPDLALIDDPQTDDTAKSRTQTEDLERLVMGAINGMAGPGRSIASMMACTVIRPDDLSDRMLNRELHPEMCGIRTKLVYQWPTNPEAERLWEEYAEIRRESMKLERGPGPENEFYLAHRQVMDEGSVVAWPERKLDTEVSAIQHAFNL